MEVPKEHALNNWVFLNAYLKDATLEDCEDLLEREKSGKYRRQFLRRIHSRLNKVRAHGEREELGIETNND